jgi:hypothetical protein
MKKFIWFSILLSLIVTTSGFTQTESKPENKSGKQGQNLLFNDFYFGYGAGSIFYFTGRMKHSDTYPTEWDYYNSNPLSKSYGVPSSFGTITLGYQRCLNRVVSLGIMFGFQDFHYTEQATEQVYQNGVYYNTLTHTIKNNDILLSGSARVLFSYVNKPSIRIYSGVALGITVDFGRATFDDLEYADNKLWPGGQLTLMGIRYGRAFGGFFEFGFGSYGIINAGISYKLAD